MRYFKFSEKKKLDRRILLKSYRFKVFRFLDIEFILFLVVFKFFSFSCLYLVEEI